MLLPKAGAVGRVHFCLRTSADRVKLRTRPRFLLRSRYSRDDQRGLRSIMVDCPLLPEAIAIRLEVIPSRLEAIMLI